MEIFACWCGAQILANTKVPSSTPAFQCELKDSWKIPARNSFSKGSLLAPTKTQAGSGAARVSWNSGINHSESWGCPRGQGTGSAWQRGGRRGSRTMGREWVGTTSKSERKNSATSSKSLFPHVLLCINVIHLFCSEWTILGFFRLLQSQLCSIQTRTRLLNPASETTLQTSGFLTVKNTLTPQNLQPKRCHKYLWEVSVHDIPVSQDSESNGAVS